MILLESIWIAPPCIQLHNSPRFPDGRRNPCWGSFGCWPMIRRKAIVNYCNSDMLYHCTEQGVGDSKIYVSTGLHILVELSNHHTISNCSSLDTSVSVTHVPQFLFLCLSFCKSTHSQFLYNPAGVLVSSSFLVRSSINRGFVVTLRGQTLSPFSWDIIPRWFFEVQL